MSDAGGAGVLGQAAGPVPRSPLHGRARGSLGLGVPVGLAVAAGLAVWAPLSYALRPFLPGPLTVAGAFVAAVADARLYEDIATSFVRVVIAWGAATLLATAIGVWMGRNRIAEGLLLPWVVVALALPSPVIVLFAILLFGVEERVAIVSLIVAVTPFVTTVLLGGVKALDERLFEMAGVYRFSRVQVLREVILPALAGPLLSASRFGFTLSWKLVLIMEAISRPDGVGARLQFFFRLLRPEDVLVWTLCFGLVMVLVEVVFFRSLSRRLFRWRPRAAGL